MQSHISVCHLTQTINTSTCLLTSSQARHPRKQGILNCSLRAFPCPYCIDEDVCPSSTGLKAVGYRWAQEAPLLAEDAGTCSMLVSTNDTYRNNSAGVAGGALFSSDLNTTNRLCSPYSLVQLSAQQPGCGISAWHNNSAGYGSSVAYPPSKLLIDAPLFLTYVSNSLDTLPMTVQVQDQAGSHVSIGMFAGMTDCETVSNCPIDQQRHNGSCMCYAQSTSSRPL